MIRPVRLLSIHVALSFLALAVSFSPKAGANCIEFFQISGSTSPGVTDTFQLGFRFVHQSTDISAIDISITTTGDFAIPIAWQRGEIYDESGPPFSTLLSVVGPIDYSSGNSVTNYTWFSTTGFAPIAVLETFNDAQGLNGDAASGFTDPGILGIIEFQVTGTAGGTVSIDLGSAGLLDGTQQNVTASASLGSVSYTFGDSLVLHPAAACIVPEPSTATLMGLGLAGLATMRRRTHR